MEEQAKIFQHHVVTIDDLGGLKRKINVTFDNFGAKSALDKAAELIRKNNIIKGYRKGKAPLHLVQKLYRKEVENIAKDFLANDGFLQACIEHKFVPLTTPKIEEFNFKIDGSFICSILVDQKPTISPVGYVGLELTKPNFNKQEVVETITSDLKAKCSKEISKEAVELGDVVSVDFVALDKEGKEITSGQDQRFAINPGLKEPFGENLIGVRVGEEVCCNTVLPEGYEERAGEEITVKIIVKSVTQNVEPTDEEMVGNLNLSTLEEYNSAMEQFANMEIDKKERAQLEEEIVDKLLDINEFEVPVEWVEEEKKYFLSQIGIETPDPQILEYAEGMARRNVRRTFVLDAIYDAEPQLRITQEEIDSIIKQEAERRGVSSLVLLKEIRDSSSLDAIVGSVRNKKVISYIISQAQFVKEQDPMVLSDENYNVPDNSLE